MKHLSKIVVLTALTLMMAAPMARADMKVSLFGAALLNQNSFGDTATAGAKGGLGYGGGLTLGIPLGQRVDFEVGGLYGRSKTDLYEAGVVTQSLYSNSYYLPGSFRFNFSPVWSLSAGGYYAIPTDSALEKDYGLQGGLRLQTTGVTKFFVDGRYSYGLKEDVTGTKRKDIIVMVGVTFGKK